MPEAPEPKDKLDTMTEPTATLMVTREGRVNGPEDNLLDWDAIEWRTHEDNVRRLRQRIFKATRDGDLKRVRSLQKLMLRSWSNTLISVRQVTQRNAGRSTAGVDGTVVVTARGRMELAVRLHREGISPTASPAPMPGRGSSTGCAASIPMPTGSGSDAATSPGWWPTEDDVTLFDPGAAAITYARYRGQIIDTTPWKPTALT